MIHQYQKKQMVRHEETWIIDLSGAGLFPSGFLDSFFLGELVLAVSSPRVDFISASGCSAAVLIELGMLSHWTRLIWE